MRTAPCSATAGSPAMNLPPAPNRCSHPSSRAPWTGSIITPEGPGGAVPFLEFADPDFSVSSDAVHQAREAGWYAHTSYGIAVLRHHQASQLISHPSLRQGSSAWPAHHGITSGPFAQWWANWVLNKEGADHRRLRKLLNPAFSPRLVQGLPPQFPAPRAEPPDRF